MNKYNKGLRTKGINVCMLLIVVLQLFRPVLDASSVMPFSSGENECITYNFNTSKSNVAAGTDIQFDFDYESKTPACTSDELSGQSFTFDFSPLIGDDSDILVNVDDGVFNYVIEDGVLTITFKDLSHVGETLTGFGGTASFTIHVKDDLDETVVIENSVGDDIEINVHGENEENTNKISDVDYVEVGDTVNYTILINNDEIHVDEFHGVDSASEGLEYVPGSFSAEEDKTWVPATDLFTATINDEGHLEVENNESFDKSYLLHYQMEVTEQFETYHNQFDAEYDQINDITGDDIGFDFGSGNWSNYNHGNIEIVKTDEEGNSLAGAEFNVLDKNGDIVDHIVTGGDGHGTSQNLSFGTYTVIETVAPDGYVLDTTPYEVALKGEGTEPIVETVNVVNQKEVGTLDLNKVDENGSPLSGAQFTVYDSNGAEVEVLTTNENGYAASGDLNLGNYSVVETKAPTGYVLDDTKYNVTISEAGKTVHVNDGNPIENKLATAQIDLNKVNEEQKPLSGAEFTVYDNNAKEVETIVTDEKGYGISSELELGDYTVVETDAPIGYITDNTEYDVTLATNGELVHVNEGTAIVNKKGADIDIDIPQVQVQGQIDLNKVDENGSPLQGAEFTIYDSKGNIADVVTTDEKGYALSSLLDLGEYTVVETNAPDGYILDDTEYNVTIASRFEVAHVNGEQAIVNELALGQLDLNKVDEDKNPLADAEFTIYDQDGKEVETIVTDENGYAISGDLKLGEYTVVETDAPTGYVLDDTEYKVTISEDGQLEHVNEGKGIINKKGVDIDIEVPQVKVQGQIDLNKADENGNPLAGAEFTIYDSSGKEVEVLTTDKDGYAKSKLIDLGDYTVVETKAPTGYVLDKTEYKVTIKSRFEIAHVNDGTVIINIKEDVEKPDTSEVDSEDETSSETENEGGLEHTGYQYTIITGVLIVVLAGLVIIRKKLS